MLKILIVFLSLSVLFGATILSIKELRQHWKVILKYSAIVIASATASILMLAAMVSLF